MKNIKNVLFTSILLFTYEFILEYVTSSVNQSIAKYATGYSSSLLSHSRCIKVSVFHIFFTFSNVSLGERVKHKSMLCNILQFVFL